MALGAKRHLLRRVLLVVLGLLGVLVALLCSGWLWLQSAPGQAFVTSKVLEATRTAIPGRLELDQLKVGIGSLHATGLRLFSPEGELVAELAELDASYSLTGLLTRTVTLQHVQLTRPRVMLVFDERGLNLMRSLSGPNTAPATATDSPTWVVNVAALELVEGAIDYRDADRHLSVDDARITGRAKFSTGSPLDLSGALSIVARSTSPVTGPLTADVSVDTGAVSALTLELAGLRVRARGDWQDTSLMLDEVSAPPETVLAFVPGWPLKVPVVVRGTADARHASLVVEAAGGLVKAEGDWSLEPLSFRAVSISATEVPLDRLLGVQLPSNVTLEARGELLDARPASLSGHLTLDADWHSAQHQRLASVQGELAARNGEVSIDALKLLTPGAALQLTGVASLQQLALEGTLTATDLSRVPATAQTFAGVELPPLGGSGALRLTASGPSAHPTVTATGRMRTLRVAGVSAQQLDLDARLTDARKPLDASVTLHAARLRFGEGAKQSLDEVHLAAITRTRLVDLRLRTKGLGDLGVHLTALLDHDLGGARLDGLALDSSTAAWGLDGPARLRWLAGQLELEALSLHDGAQHLLATGRLDRAEVDAEVKLENLILERLPAALVPADLGLAGLLSAQVSVTGPRSSPSGTGQLTLKGGRISDVRDLEASLDARFGGDRLAGTISATASLGTLAGDFDLPYQALLEQGGDPLRAHLVATNIDLDRVKATFSFPLPIGGLLSAELLASGTGGRPMLDLTVKSDRLRVDAPTRTGEILQVVQPVLRLRTAEDQTLGVEAQALIFDGTVKAGVETPFTIAGLRKHLPTVAELQRTRAHVRIDVADLGLLALDTMQLIDNARLAGAVGLSGTIDGSLLDPTADLTLTGESLAFPPLARVDLMVRLQATNQNVVLAGRLGTPQHIPCELKATLAATLDGLVRPDIFAARALSVEATVAPFEIGEILVGQDGHPPPSGTLSGRLTLTGTLEAPRLSVAGHLTGLRLEKTALGAAHFELEGDGAKQQLQLRMGGAQADQLTVEGRFGLPLSFSKLAADGVTLGASPLVVEFDSRHLDLAFLSGVQPVLRVLAGTLDAKGSVTGTFAAPKFLGEAHWANGRLALMGYGDYRDIAFDVRATNDLVDVSRVVARSGGGSAEAHFTLSRTSPGAFHLTGAAQSTRFPIVVDDQPLATASLEATLEGDLSRELIFLHTINLPRVDLALPALKRKDLQDLQLPDDIIVLQAGSRASREQAARARQAAAPASPIAVKLRVNAPRNIWVRGADVNLELGLSDGFQVAVADGAQIIGSAHILRGDVSVLGRKFTLQPGSKVGFSGLPTEPTVDVTAKHVNTKENVTVTLTAFGKGTNVSIKVSSDPPLSESDIYTLLATGRLTLQRGSGASLTPEDAVSVVGQLAASEVKTILAKQLPIDVLNFETTDNFSRVKLDVGKYLSDRVYLGFSAQTGADPARGENPYSARIEFQINKSWNVEAHAGTAPAAGADIFWSKDF